MVTMFLTYTTILLALVLGIGLTLQYYAHDKRMQEKKKRNTDYWNTVFDRTDLKKFARTAKADEA